MLIKDIFYYPITRQITQVIKLDDISPAEITQELSEYVVTDQIEQQLLEFLEPFVATRKGQQTQADRIGVWLSGFFGSGKSHLAKILGYLLHNAPVQVDGADRQAIEVFLDRVIESSPRKQAIRGALTELRNFFQNQVLMFQIKSEENQLDRENETISLIMYRQYLAALGLSSDPWIGRLELTLRRRGRFEAFRAAIEREEHERWEELRKDFALVRPAIIRAMRAAMPETYHTDDQASQAFNDIRTGLSLSPADLVRELSDYAAAQDATAGERSFKLVYIIDEVGQFIGDNGQRLLELQAIAEQFAVQGQGRLWMIVTAQEALEAVVAGVRQVRQDYARIIDRFGIQLRLTSENIEQVLQERILKKRPAAHSTIAELFGRHQGQIALLAAPESNRRIVAPNNDQFERTYPFLPYQFQLMQDAFATLRARGGSKAQLSGAERSMLGVVQGVLNAPDAKFEAAQLGRLVRLDEIYDQVLREISGDDRRAISSVAEYVQARDLSPEQVLKAVFLLTQVEWLPRTLDNIARVLMPVADADFNQHRAAIAQALNDLKDARYLIEVDGQFRYLSSAERGIEDEIASESIKHNDIRRAARELLRTVLSGIGRINYQNGLASFDVRVIGDDEEIKGTGEITLYVYSPIACGYDPELSVANVRDIKTPGETRKVFWLPGDITDPHADLERLLRLEVVTQRRTGGDPGGEERAILREKAVEATALRTRLEQVFNRALFTGTFLYDGNATPLDGKTTNLNSIFNRELSQIVPHVYTRFNPAGIKLTEKNIGEMLTTKVGNLQNVAPGLHLWDAQGHPNTHAPVVQHILDWLRQRGMVVDGKTLAEYFGSAPFGWETVVLRVVLAALFRAGTISIIVGQRYFTDPGDPTAQEALTKSTVFNKAAFDYDPTGGLTLDERREARRQLDLLFERQVDDTTNVLVQTIREELERLKRQNELLLVQIQGTNLPVDDLLYQGKKLLEGVLSPSKPDGVVKAFLKDIDPLTALQKLQQQIHTFISLGHDKAYRRIKRIAEAIARAMGDIKTLDTEAIKHALEDLQSLEQSRSIIEHWDAAQQAGSTLLAAYQHTYTELFSQRTQAYSSARDQVEAFGPAPTEITNRIVQGQSTWDDDGLGYVGQHVTLLDLYNDLQLVEQRQIKATAAIQAEQESGRAEQDDQGKQAYVFIQVSDYLSGEIADEQTLETKLGAFAVKVLEELRRGRKVLIK